MTDVPVQTSSDDVHAHPHKTGRHWFDLIIAVTAIFISIVSLYVAIEHGRTERDLVASNSWPFLQALLNDNYRGERQIAIGVTNAGTGPAKIYSFEVALDGKWLSSPRELLQRCCGVLSDAKAFEREVPVGTLSMSSIDNTVLRPADENPVFVFRRTAANTAVVDRLDSAVRRLTFHVCYCSTIDQCWEGTLLNLDANPVKKCALPRHPYRFDDRSNTK